MTHQRSARSVKIITLVTPLVAVWSLQLYPSKLLAQPAPQGSTSGAPSPTASSAAPDASSQNTDTKREEARQLLRQGLALYRAGDAAKALDYFIASKKVLSAKGNTLNAANCLRDLGRLDEALEYYEDAIAHFSTSFDDDDKRTVPTTVAELRTAVGLLFISSNASGTILIDGRVRGSLPLASDIRLMPGEHRLRIVKQGYQTFEKNFTIRAGSRETIDAKLEQLTVIGGLRVEDTTLQSGDLIVDGVIVGQLPWEGQLAPGPHVVFTRSGNKGSLPTLATVLQGQTTLVRVRSGVLAPEIEVVVEPTSAEIKLGEVPLGKGKWVGSLSPGRYQLTVSEEGYFPQTPAIDITESPQAPIRIKLKIDENHPRWPKRPSGKFSLHASLGYALGGGFSGDVERSCDTGKCSSGLVNGPALSAGARFEFPFRLDLNLAGGFLSLEQRTERTLPREALVGANSSVSYTLNDLQRFKGYWLGLGAGYRIPIGKQFSLRAGVLGGLILARSSTTTTAEVVTPTGSATAFLDGAGTEVSSTPLFVQPQLGFSASFGRWQIGAELSAWVIATKGPKAPTGSLVVPPNCPIGSVQTAGCIADSQQLASETTYRSFVFFVPQVVLTHTF